MSVIEKTAVVVRRKRERELKELLIRVAEGKEGDGARGDIDGLISVHKILSNYDVQSGAHARCSVFFCFIVSCNVLFICLFFVLAPVEVRHPPNWLRWRNFHNRE